jgi:hypothetical protein
MNDDTQNKGISVDEPQHVVRTFASDMEALARGGGGQMPSSQSSATPQTLQSAVQEASPLDAIEKIPQRPQEDRSAILARLRATANARPVAPPVVEESSRMSLGAGMVGSLPHAPDLPNPTPVPMQIPAYREPLPEPAPIALVAAPVLQPIAPQPIAPDDSRLHTYTSDFQDRIDTRQASSFAVLAAQQDAPRQQQAPIQSSPSSKRDTRTIVLAVSAGLLILFGGVGLFAAYRIATKVTTVAIAPTIPSLIFVDDRVEVSGTGASLMQSIAQAAGSTLAANNVRLTYLTVATTTALGTTHTPVPGGQLIQALNLSAPDILLRNVGAESMVGIVHAGDTTAPFFILRVLSYEASFRGMLSWEPQMATNLAIFYPSFPQPVVVAPPVATSTATGSSTPTVQVASNNVSSAPQFRDEVVANHDVRALKDTSGNTILLYGYRDQQNLIIARNEDAFIEILNRLSSTK